MTQVPYSVTNKSSYASPSSFTFLSAGLIVGILFSAIILVGTYSAYNTFAGIFGKPTSSYPTHTTAAVEQHVQAHLDIIVHQSGPQSGWPGYSPASLVVPAHSLVTLTIRNYDLGDTPLTANSPFTQVQGTVGGIATVDGKPYTMLAPAKVAHTFTLAAMHVSVPIPGDGPKGASYVSVTFSFHTGSAGTYTFQCYDPCGTGMSGWMGPMMTKGYMVGTVTVQ